MFIALDRVEVQLAQLAVVYIEPALLVTIQRYLNPRVLTVDNKPLIDRAILRLSISELLQAHKRSVLVLAQKLRDVEPLSLLAPDQVLHLLLVLDSLKSQVHLCHLPLLQDVIVQVFLECLGDSVLAFGTEVGGALFTLRHGL